MKKLITVCLLTLGLAVPALANAEVQLKGKYPACVTSDAFDRLSAIIQHKDEKAFTNIMSSECFMPKAGVPVDSVVSLGWTTGIAHIKVYNDGRLYDLWTNTENVGNSK